MKTDTRTNYTRLARNANGRFLPRFHTIKVERNRGEFCIATGMTETEADKLAQRMSTIGETDRIGVLVDRSILYPDQYCVLVTGTTETENQLFQALAYWLRDPATY